jgi:hypothetical protein
MNDHPECDDGNYPNVSLLDEPLPVSIVWNESYSIVAASPAIRNTDPLTVISLRD